MVKWAEIVAAATVAFFVWQAVRPKDGQIAGENRDYLPPRREVLNITPYRNYDNLVIRDGRVIGGL
jgi:hypothetical protein